MNKQAEAPFYEEGLHFTCTRCSKCCRHESGYVFLSESDVLRLAKFKGLSRESFLETYTRKVNLGIATRITLNEQENFDCTFWKDGGCSVYPARPLQCRSFPFWPMNIASREAWEAAGDDCPGVNIGSLHSREDIDSWNELRKKEPFIEY